MVQSVKKSLSSSSKNNEHDVQQNLDNFLLTYRSTKHATVGCSPAQLFLGRDLRTRISLVRPNLKENVINKQGTQKFYYDQHSKYREFFPGDAVLVRDPRKEETWWPGTIAERSAPKTYIVTLTDGRVWKRHVDHLKRRELVAMPEEERKEELVQDKLLRTHQRNAINETPRTTEMMQQMPSPSLSSSPAISQEPSQAMSQTSGVPLRKSQRSNKPPRRLIEEC